MQLQKAPWTQQRSLPLSHDDRKRHFNCAQGIAPPNRGRLIKAVGFPDGVCWISLFFGGEIKTGKITILFPAFPGGLSLSIPPPPSAIVRCQQTATLENAPNPEQRKHTVRA